MWVALQDAPVHECAGVALVGVADDKFLIRFLLVGGFPFDSCREARAAAASEAGFLYFADYIQGIFFKTLENGKVAVPRDVGVQRRVFHLAAVAQNDLYLFPEEGDVLHFGDMYLAIGVQVGILFRDASAHKVAFDDLTDLIRVQLYIEVAAWIDEQLGADGAGTHAAGGDYLNLFRKTVNFKGCRQRLTNRLAVGRDTACAAADQNVILIALLFVQVGFFDFLQFVRTLNHCQHPLPSDRRLKALLTFPV
ncbi:hypothetical protein SDC9_72044 [bioreactor metagenome]|uniref:Uncharacterized protein n=1 Tax=bioreactor metagenome TaxID=1076179 RepID=A0A644YC77_9ZZZZ